MTIKKLTFISVIFVVILVCIRMFWLSFFTSPDQPQAIQGVLDLRSYTHSEEEVLLLNGEWEFYPNQLFDQNHPERMTTEINNSYISVPGDWTPYLQSKSNSNLEFGTYRLNILLGNYSDFDFALHIPIIRMASEVFINGESVYKAGQPSNQLHSYARWNVPYTIYLDAIQGEVEIIITASNDHFRAGGIVQPIQFGSDSSIRKATIYSISMELLVCIILFVHMLYAIIIYLLGERQKLLLWFALLIICHIFTIIADDSKLIFQLLPISYELGTKVLILSFLGVALFLFQYIRYLVPEYLKWKSLSVLLYIPIISAIFVIIAPYEFVISLPIYYFIAISFVWPYLLIPILLLRTVLKGDKDVIYLFLGSLAVMINIFGAALLSRNDIEVAYYPVDIIIAFLCFATYWFKTYFRTSNEARNLAEKLKIEDHRKDKFLAITSHEMRNPLHSIINIVQSILDNSKLPIQKEYKKDLELVVSIGKHMANTLNDLQDITRIKENRLHIYLQRIRIQDMINIVIEILEYMMEGKDIRIKSKVPDDFPHVKADEHRLIQILLNLLHNAIKFTPSGEISIYVEKNNNQAIFHIQDTGTGIEKERMDKIFTTYQTDTYEAGINQGLGLGLSITKHLVELHGGNLTVQSTIGEGSIFTFSLHLDDTKGDVNKPNSNEVTRESINRKEIMEKKSMDQVAVSTQLTDNNYSPRILVVDDDPVNIKVIKRILSVEQYIIETANSAKEVLDKINQKTWDLLISDVMMPQMSGYELTQILRQRFSLSELPILLLTARTEPEDILAAISSGANDYISKPIHSIELRSRVKVLTNLKESVQEQLKIKAAYLQAQMKPHFLFNTLNSIAALSRINIEEMNQLLISFSEYLRISYDSIHTQNFVSLKQELNLIRAYLDIEKARFQDIIRIKWEISADLNTLIPPLTIQPLVENAIHHGILAQVDGGELCIRIASVQNGVKIEVSDNGVGIEEEKQEEILESGIKDKVGLYNTHQRLKQSFGTGLHIESKPGEGTSVSFFVPKNKS